MKIEKEVKMMKYEVLQINLTREQSDLVNSSKDYPEFYNLYLNTTFRPTVEAIKAAKDMYKKVAVITANSFDGVFTASNVGYEDQIERFAPMHSVSVGDILVREDGVSVYVDTMGFRPVSL
jgi:hypothetical protein